MRFRNDPKRPLNLKVALVLALALSLMQAGVALAERIPDSLDPSTIRSVSDESSSTSTTARPRLSPKLVRDLDRLPPDAPYGAFLHFPEGNRADHSAFATRHGLRVIGRYPSVDVIYATGIIRDFIRLKDESELSYIEANRRLRLLGNTSGWATRTRYVQEPALSGPFLDAEGKELDGRGVGVAVVDTGVDATHPDLAQRVVKNFKAVCTTPALINATTRECFGPFTWTEIAYGDASGGHGTHVAGIVAGDGTASDGMYLGAAPGASIFGFGVGEALSIFSNVEAFQYILQNHDKLVPKIRVVTNSYGDDAGTPFDPEGVFTKLTDQLVEQGITVLFAAGNDGGNGSADMTTSMSKNPTPGVISVGNYHDGGTGTRSGNIYSGSSRGRNGTPATYPDVSAPGVAITATCRPTMPVCDLGLTDQWAPNYASLTGTSMATPHVAGIAALLYEADPTITPAGIEDLLQDTARKYGSGYKPDLQNPGGTTSFDKGAGLVDAEASLKALGVSGASPGPTTERVLAEDAIGDSFFGATDFVKATVTEIAGGMRYGFTVADLADRPPATVTLTMNQMIEGRPFITDIDLTAAGAQPRAFDETQNNAVATNVKVTGNEITFELPFSSLGSPASGSLAYNINFFTYTTLAQDGAPGGSGIESAARPQFGTPYMIVRPSAASSPTPSPTSTPTGSPTPSPTASSSETPKPDPTGNSSPTPTTTPSESPSPSPTASPTATPAPSSAPSPSPTGSPSPSPSPSPVSDSEGPRETTVTPTGRSATTATYYDVALVEVRVVDETGSPVVNQDVTYELSGAQGLRTQKVVTDDDGVATGRLLVDVPPGRYELIGSYPGQSGKYSASETVTTFRVARRVSAATLDIRLARKKHRSRVKPRLVAHLSDRDATDAPLVDAFVSFYARGVLAGSATTNNRGVARMVIPRRYRGRGTSFKLVYDGDDFYLPASAKAAR